MVELGLKTPGSQSETCRERLCQRMLPVGRTSDADDASGLLMIACVSEYFEKEMELWEMILWTKTSRSYAKYDGTSHRLGAV